MVSKYLLLCKRLAFPKPFHDKLFTGRTLVKVPHIIYSS